MSGYLKWTAWTRAISSADRPHVNMLLAPGSIAIVMIDDHTLPRDSTPMAERVSRLSRTEVVSESPAPTFCEIYFVAGCIQSGECGKVML